MTFKPDERIVAAKLWAPSSLSLSHILILLQSVIDSHKGVAAGRRAEGVPGVDMVGERHTVVTHRHDSTVLKGTVDQSVWTVPVYLTVTGNITSVMFLLLCYRRDG